MAVPSPLNNDSPRDPAAVRKRLTTILDRADCKRVRFHDLRHTFATASLEHGMDIKTLSTIIGHVSTATTLNVYAHVTDEMRKIAAAKIDRGIAKSESLQDIDTAPRKPAPSTFLPHKGQRRNPALAASARSTKKLWEGRYSPKLPNGDRLARNVYAHSEKECEQKLAELIVQMKAEIAAQRQQPLSSGMNHAKKKRGVPDAMSGTPLRSVCGILCGQQKSAKPYSFKKLPKPKKTPEIRRFQVLFWSC